MRVKFLREVSTTPLVVVRTETLLTHSFRRGHSIRHRRAYLVTDYIASMFWCRRRNLRCDGRNDLIKRGRKSRFVTLVYYTGRANMKEYDVNKEQGKKELYGGISVRTFITGDLKI